MGVRIDGSNDVISAADGSLTVDGLSLSVTGIITASGGFKVGSAYTAYSNGNVETTGIITTSGGLNVTGGELGIGTAIPGAKTHINSGSNNTPLIVEASGTNRSRVVFRNNTETGTECNIELFDDDLRFVTNSGERFRIDADGRLLVGTDASQAHASANLVEIGDYSLTNAGITINNPTDGAGLILFGDSSSTNRRGRIEYNHTADAFRLYTADSERVRITSTGLVGIGSETPDTALEVFGSGAIAKIKAEGQTNARVRIEAGNTSSSYLEFGDSDDSDVGEIVYDHSTNAMRFRTNGSPHVYIDSSGRLLLGTDTSRSVGSERNLQIEGTNGANSSISVVRNSNTTGGPSINIGKSRGTSVNVDTIVQNNDTLGTINFRGADGVDLNGVSAAISAAADGTPGSDDTPGRLIFSTTADGSNTATERLRITSGGFVNVNQANNNNLQGRVTIFDGGNFSTASQLGSGDTDNIYLISDTTSADGGYGASIAWSRIQYADRRAAAIASVQTTSDEDQVGLAFFTHPSTDAAAAMVEAMRVDHAGRLLIGSTQRTVGGINCALHVEGTGADDSSIALVRNTNNGTTPPYLMFGRSRSGSLGGDTIMQSGDLLGYLSFNGADGNDLDGGAAAIQAAVDGTPGSNDMPGRLEFMTTADGNNSPSIRMGINRNGELRMGYGNSDPVSTDQVHSIGDPSLDTITTNLARLVMQERSSNWISFKDGGGTHYGTISRSGSNVSYGGQSSDYRIKENVVGVSTGIDTLKRLRPVHFNYTTDSGFSEEERSVVEIGFIAHEFSEVCPHGVIGEKDAYEILGDCVDDTTGKTTQRFVYESQAKDGETWTETSREPKYQQIDFSKAVPVLTAALQEAITKIETLEAKVAVLEGG